LAIRQPAEANLGAPVKIASTAIAANGPAHYGQGGYPPTNRI